MNEQLSLIDTAAAQVSKRPSEPIVRSARIEDNYRWWLKRAWGDGPCILWCGVNPSTANAQRDDPTMWREIEFSYRWGFGSLIKINIYPFISANQAALRKWKSSWKPEEYEPIPWGLDKSAFNAWLYNLDVAREQTKRATMFMAAWGNGADRDDLEVFLTEIQTDYDMLGDAGFGSTTKPITWYCLDKNGDGYPTHTLARGVHRIPDDAKPILWRSPT